MKRAARRRQLLFFSTSLFAHCLFVLILIVLSLVVSDTAPVGADRPLVVSLDGGGPAGGTMVREKDTDRRPHPRRESNGTVLTDHSGDPREGLMPGSPEGIPRIEGGDDAGETALLSDYIGRVHARINRSKRYPPGAARDGIEGTVTVSFLLDRRGTLLERSIASGSGHVVLDEAALAAVGDASPFPPFPDGLERETLRLRLPINYRRR